MNRVASALELLNSARASAYVSTELSHMVTDNFLQSL